VITVVDIGYPEPFT